MAKKLKRLIDLTTDEFMKRLFPKKVIGKAKQVAHEKDNSLPKMPISVKWKGEKEK